MPTVCGPSIKQSSVRSSPKKLTQPLLKDVCQLPQDKFNSKGLSIQEKTPWYSEKPQLVSWALPCQWDSEKLRW